MWPLAAVPRPLVGFPDPFGRRVPATQRQEQPAQEILFVLPLLFHISTHPVRLFVLPLEIVNIVHKTL